MCSNLSDYQLKIDCYIHRLLYKSIMVVTNQKSIRDTHTHAHKEKEIQTQH